MKLRCLLYPDTSKAGCLIFTLFVCLVFSQQVVAQASPAIKINQVGFYTDGPKLAMVTAPVKSEVFYITSTNLRDTVFRGTLGEAMKSPYSNTITRPAEFSSLHTKGSFVVLVPGTGHSYVFRIGDDVYREIAVSTLKGFYFQRASMPLEEQYAGRWHRSTGHPDDRVLVHPSAASSSRSPGTVIPSPGGWYDAGDYNKYMVNSGIAMGTLLSAYEDFPDHFSSLELNIPESNNGVPDILDETLYNLRWMLTMQDGDGGVYHKCTNAAFDNMVMPGVTKLPRYVVQKGTAATLDFAAVAAQAGRVFKRFEKIFPGLADSCMNAAQRAWTWAERNPAILYDQVEMNKNFKPEITTGAYGDRNVKDEWVWAAAEMYLSTGDEKFLEVVRLKMGPTLLPSWANVGTLGYYSLIRLAKNQNPTVQKLVGGLKDSLLTIARRYIQQSKQNAFRTVMGQSARDFNWGGNSNAANQGILLMQAYRWTNDPAFLKGALSNMDYILGRNATGYCFITGAGSKSPMHPHHRPSEADGITEPVPGLMVGGPNPGMQDKCDYPLKDPEVAYTDVLCSYASNEIAINWNAPIAYLANAIEALKKHSGLTKSGHAQPAKIHGQLKVVGTELRDQNNQPVVLRGMSFGWHNYWPRFYNKEAVRWLVDDWKCNVVRAAMGVEPERGYIKDPAGSTQKIEAVVNGAIEAGVYVIIDWHSHNINLEEAKHFFSVMARKYGKYPNVIYEIFNEPDYESWQEVKSYSEAVIEAIRKEDPDNVIIVGSPHWDQDIHLVADEPLKQQTNIMYALHFYAATHKGELRKRADYALSKGLPLFISESAGMEASGDGNINEEEWMRWIEWAEQKRISWIAWSVSDKDETCSVLKKNAASTGGWTEEQLRESGIKARNLFRKYNLQ